MPPDVPEVDLSDQLAALPPRPGCYLFYSRRGELLYVGKIPGSVTVALR